MKALFKINNNSDLITSLSPNPPPPPHPSSSKYKPRKNSHALKGHSEYRKTSTTSHKSPNTSRSRKNSVNRHYSNSHIHLSETKSKQVPLDLNLFEDEKDFAHRSTEDDQQNSPLTFSTRSGTHTLQSNTEKSIDTGTTEQISKLSSAINKDVKPAIPEFSSQSKFGREEELFNITDLCSSSCCSAEHSPFKIKSSRNRSSKTDSQLGSLNTHINLLEPISPISPILLHSEESLEKETTSSQHVSPKLHIRLSRDDSCKKYDPFEKYLAETLAIIDKSPGFTSAKWFLPSPTLGNCQDNNQRLSKAYTTPKITKRQSSLPVTCSINSHSPLIPPNSFASPMVVQSPTIFSSDLAQSDIGLSESSRDNSASSIFGHKSVNSSFSSNDTSPFHLGLEDNYEGSKSIPSPMLGLEFDYERFHQLRTTGSKQNPYHFEYRLDEKDVQANEYDELPQSSSRMADLVGAELPSLEFNQKIVYSRPSTAVNQNDSMTDETMSQLPISPRSKHSCNMEPYVSNCEGSLPDKVPQNTDQIVRVSRPSTLSVRQKVKRTNDSQNLNLVSPKFNEEVKIERSPMNKSNAVPKRKMYVSMRRDSEPANFLNKELPTIPDRISITPQPRGRKGNHDTNPNSYYEWDCIDANLNMINSSIDKWNQIENKQLFSDSSIGSKQLPVDKRLTETRNTKNLGMPESFLHTSSRNYDKSTSVCPLENMTNTNIVANLEGSQTPKAINMKTMDQATLNSAGKQPHLSQQNEDKKSSMRINQEMFPASAGVPMTSSFSPGSPTSVYSEIIPPTRSASVEPFPQGRRESKIQQHRFKNSYCGLVKDNTCGSVRSNKDPKDLFWISQNALSANRSPPNSSYPHSLPLDTGSNGNNNGYPKTVTVPARSKNRAMTIDSFNENRLNSRSVSPSLVHTTATSSNMNTSGTGIFAYQESDIPWMPNSNEDESTHAKAGKVNTSIHGGFSLLPERISHESPERMRSASVAFQRMPFNSQQDADSENLGRLGTWKKRFRKPSMNIRRHNN